MENTWHFSFFPSLKLISANLPSVDHILSILYNVCWKRKSESHYWICSFHDVINLFAKLLVFCSFWGDLNFSTTTASFNDNTVNVSRAVKPECHIERERFEGKDYVVCSAIANPKETDFVWSLKNDNDTLEQVAEMRNGRSYMPLDTSVTNSRTYVCVANNTIGYSTPCERDVAG